MLYSFFLKNIIIPVGDLVMKTSVYKNIRLIKKLNKLDKEQINEWQNKKLQKLIKHAYENTDYYKALFDKNNLKIEDIKSITDLHKIPILTKKDIRENFEKIKSKNHNSIPHDIKSTGGSTGEPLKYLLDKNSWSYSNANNIINWEKAGYKYGEKFVSLGSTSLFVNKKKSLKHWIYYQLKQKIGLNGINMSDKICQEYVDFLNKNKIKYIYGYASSIYLLAKYVHKKNIKTNIKICFTTSEVLVSTYRETISKAFGCKIIDCYGANDGGITAFSHQISSFEVSYNCLVINDNNDNSLLTDLNNFSMPLINYQVGDFLELKEKHEKSDNFNGQILNKVNGRQSEILNFVNNRQITAPGFTILFKDIPVEYYCLEKTNTDSVVCWYSSDEELDDVTSNIILETLQKQLGPEIKIDLKKTTTPFLSKSGKRKFILDSTLTT
jgi:phenylacetate-CoA ligase